MASTDDVLRAIGSAQSSGFSGGGGSFTGSSTARPSTSGGSGAVQSRPIYMGPLTPRVEQTPRTSAMRYDNRTGKVTPLIPGTKPKLIEREALSTVEDERGRVYQWYGTKSFDDWGDYLLDLGLIDEEESRDIRVLDKWWEQALELSASFYEKGKRISPRNALQAIAGVSRDGKPGSGRPRGFTGSKTRTDTQVDLTDPKTAKALANDVLSRALGRNANDEEIEAFKNALNSYERSNPSVSTTVAEYVEDEQVSSSTTTTGGVTGAGRQELLMEQAMQKPEYGAYQAAATYMNALLGSLGTMGGN